MSGTLTVLSPGSLTTVQDLGRQGHASSGVGVSGAADRASLRLANRLVGNPEDAAGLEVTFGGLQVACHGGHVLALTGAPCPAVVNGRVVAHNSVLVLRDGDVLSLGPPASGLRTYLAARGGVELPPVLGSRSSDILAGLGPSPLRAGSVLPVGRSPQAFPLVDVAPVAVPATGDLTLRVRLGPRDAWFTPSAVEALTTRPWLVTPDSNRVGMRLAGPELTRAGHGELPSEGVVLGALQVPPSGQPTLFLADHPVTGGYPVIAVVVASDVDCAAQARPGQRLFFRLAR
jgi:biotin-dependent carboxylase-like uncharacterized protein